MPLPLNYDTVPVRGKFVYLDGSPASGQIKFAGKIAAVSDAADTIILPNTIIAVLDTSGTFAVNLPATDDPDIQPNGWTYTVSETLAGGGGRTYDIEVPISAKAAGIDLSDVAPRPASVGTPTAFVTLQTFQNHVSSVEGGAADWNTLANKPATFPPSSHTHTKTEVGLANVDNTSDLAKPVSTATQTALNNKRDVLVLAPGAPVPGGTRVGSIILRTA